MARVYHAVPFGDDRAKLQGIYEILKSNQNTLFVFFGVCCVQCGSLYFNLNKIFQILISKYAKITINVILLLYLLSEHPFLNTEHFTHET